MIDFEKIKNIVDYLATHNKNYTKKQYNCIMDLQELLQEKEQKTEQPTNKRVFEQMSDEGVDTTFYFDNFEESFPNAFIWGNRDFCEFGIDDKIKEALNNSFDTKELLENLKKRRGKTTNRGLCEAIAKAIGKICSL